MTVHQGGCAFTIAYDGELWNAAELRRELEAQCFHFHTSSDTEVVLKAYLCYGEACAPRLCGSYAFVVDDSLRRLTFLCRDRFGGKAAVLQRFRTTGWPLPRNSRDFSNIPVWPRRWEEKGSVKCWGWTPSALRAALSLSTFRR